MERLISKKVKMENSPQLKALGVSHCYDAHLNSEHKIKYEGISDNSVLSHIQLFFYLFLIVCTCTLSQSTSFFDVHNKIKYIIIKQTKKIKQETKGMIRL